MKRALKISWLNACPLCQCRVHLVVTAGAGNWLYENDTATCTKCGHKGLIFTDAGNAEIIWSEETCQS